MTAEEVQALVEGRRGLDLFLDFTKEEARGFLSGRTDRKGVFREAWLTRTHAGIVAELVEARREIRATALECFKAAGVGRQMGAAVKLVQQARKLVDVNEVVNGRENRRRWRAFHTVGERTNVGFVFRAPEGFRWGVVVGRTGNGR